MSKRNLAQVSRVTFHNTQLIRRGSPTTQGELITPVKPVVISSVVPRSLPSRQTRAISAVLEADSSDDSEVDSDASRSESESIESSDDEDNNDVDADVSQKKRRVVTKPRVSGAQDKLEQLAADYGEGLDVDVDEDDVEGFRRRRKSSARAPRASLKSPRASQSKNSQVRQRHVSGRKDVHTAPDLTRLSTSEVAAIISSSQADVARIAGKSPYIFAACVSRSGPL